MEAACWSHARRKFYDIHEQQRKLPGTLAHEALQRIGAIFAIEADFQGQLPEERMRQRGLRTRPVLDERQRWLTAPVETARIRVKADAALFHFTHDVLLQPEAVANVVRHLKPGARASSHPA